MKIESYKTQDGKSLWKVKGYLGLDPHTGKRIDTSLNGFKTKTAAKTAFDDAKYELKHGTHKKKESVEKQVQRKRGYTVQQVYDLWWPIYVSDLEDSTALKTKRIFRNHILPKFGKMYIKEIEILTCQQWMSSLAKKMSSYRKVTAYAEMMFRFAVRMKFMPSNPFDSVEPPRKKKEFIPVVTKNYYERTELIDFIKALNSITNEDTSINHDWSMARAYLFLVLTTGMRRGEAIAMRWKNIDFKNGQIIIAHAEKRGEEGVYIGGTKSKAGNRTIALDEVAKVALNNWHINQAKWLNEYGRPAISPDTLIFTNRNHPDMPLSENTPRDWMVDLCEAKGIRRITIHGLRHTKATLASEAGANMVDLAAILGHADSNFTAKQYVHPTNVGINNAEVIYSNIINQAIE
ncbi:tyrosine-type recombinase/integrase [Lapidilactobacillus wuchangensis]|uniref:tyrosine-type recombinase/integrase n=1 Tax=Lapidilactobacillus wuchangensis TaxID=2486001 RepID=UPI000F76A8A0|nr:site-specific integrase [Lapidilactobacillus wuchangensis]